MQGYVSFFGRLYPLPGSTRSLGFSVPSGTTQFVNTPGQVAFSPNGSQLLVTTKASGSDIDVFGVGQFGYLSASPMVNAEPGAVPFAVTFDPSGHLVVTDAGTNALVDVHAHPGRHGDPDRHGADRPARRAGSLRRRAISCLQRRQRLGASSGCDRRVSSPCAGRREPIRARSTPQPRSAGRTSTSRPVERDRGRVLRAARTERWPKSGPLPCEAR